MSQRLKLGMGEDTDAILCENQQVEERHECFLPDLTCGLVGELPDKCCAARFISGP